MQRKPWAAPGCEGRRSRSREPVQRKPWAASGGEERRPSRPDEGRGDGGRGAQEEAQDDGFVAKVIEGNTKQNGDRTWLVEALVPRAGGHLGGKKICIRGSLRMDPADAEEDVRKFREAYESGGCQAVQALRTEMRQNVWR